MCHQVSADPLETYQLKRFHQGNYNLNGNMGGEQGGPMWGQVEQRGEDRTLTLRRVVFVGSSFVLHSTCKTRICLVQKKLPKNSDQNVNEAVMVLLL